MGKLEGKVALVTGGGTGIGKEIGKQFAMQGASVIICGRRESELKKAAEEISAFGLQCSQFVCDIGSEDDVIALFERILSSYGQLDILVNNASVVGQIGPIDTIDLKQWEEALRVNLTGLVACCREAVKIMKQQASGAIVNISSNVGKRGFRNRSPYVCSKWAMHGLSQTIALETAQYGIRCNTICPGPVMTDRLKSSIERQAKERGLTEEQIIEEWTAESPMKRFATEAECARVVLFLACDDSSAMTGQALNVTAGVIMT